MATRRITTEPKASFKLPGWLYAYTDKSITEGPHAGKFATVILPDSIRDLVHAGQSYDDSCFVYDPALGATVLTLDFDSTPAQDPSLPPNPDAGWGDPDSLTAGTPSTTCFSAAHRPMTTVPRASAITPGSPAAVASATVQRQRTMDQVAKRLDPQVVNDLDMIINSYKYLSAGLGALDAPRASEIRALAITAFIQASRRNAPLNLEPDEFASAERL